MLWQMVSAMSQIGPESGSSSAPGDWRSSPPGCRAVVAAAREYLERAFRKFVQSAVYDNLRGAQLGGVPGTLQLIRSFLRLKIDPAAPGMLTTKAPFFKYGVCITVSVILSSFQVWKMGTTRVPLFGPPCTIAYAAATEARPPPSQPTPGQGWPKRSNSSTRPPPLPTGGSARTRKTW